MGQSFSCCSCTTTNAEEDEAESRRHRKRGRRNGGSTDVGTEAPTSSSNNNNNTPLGETSGKDCSFSSLAEGTKESPCSADNAEKGEKTVAAERRKRSVEQNKTKGTKKDAHSKPLLRHQQQQQHHREESTENPLSASPLHHYHRGSSPTPNEGLTATVTTGEDATTEDDEHTETSDVMFETGAEGTARSLHVHTKRTGTTVQPTPSPLTTAAAVSNSATTDTLGTNYHRNQTKKEEEEEGRNEKETPKRTSPRVSFTYVAPKKPTAVTAATKTTTTMRSAKKRYNKRQSMFDKFVQNYEKKENLKDALDVIEQAFRDEEKEEEEREAMPVHLILHKYQITKATQAKVRRWIDNSNWIKLQDPEANNLVLHRKKSSSDMMRNWNDNDHSSSMMMMAALEDEEEILMECIASSAPSRSTGVEMSVSTTTTNTTMDQRAPGGSFSTFLCNPAAATTASSVVVVHTPLLLDEGTPLVEYRCPAFSSEVGEF